MQENFETAAESRDVAYDGAAEDMPVGDVLSPSLSPKTSRLADHLYGNYAIETIANLRFLDGVPGESIITKETFGVEMSAMAFADQILDTVHAITGKRTDWQSSASGYAGHLTSTIPNTLMMHMSYNQNRDPIKQRRDFFTVDLLGRTELVLRIKKALQDHFGPSRLATISWLFKGDGRTQQRSIVLEPPPSVCDEFYPCLDVSVDTFLDDYMASSASILFLMGEPGTGKTSLVRHLIYSRNLAAVMTYDEDLLAQDQVFVNFLTSDDEALFVIEDADTMLGSRESENNKLISRFLNVSDGLIKLSGKKIIFTTNLGDFKRVDPALVRPGRCFGAVKFRPLTPKEAHNAAVAAGLTPLPDLQREITLAELFNRTTKAPELVQIGF